MNTTDFVVGTTLKHELDGDKAKLETPKAKRSNARSSASK